MLTTRAPAKINLTLAIHGRRSDGYHDMTSLVAFAGIGDSLSLDPARADGLSITGPFASGLAADDGNLVLKAVQHLNTRRPLGHVGHFTLIKRLPVASGIGGGSADAAAALRLLARARGWPTDLPDVMVAARQTGADVPVCLMSKARMMAGIGDVLGVPLKLPKLHAVLINPGVPVSTAAVFAALNHHNLEHYDPTKPAPTFVRNAPGLQQGQLQTSASEPHMAVGPWRDGGPEDTASLIDGILHGHANDLEAAACRIQPVIKDVLEALGRAKGCLMARMSGSGATCFGLFADRGQSLIAARSLTKTFPHWWIRATVLR